MPMEGIEGNNVQYAGTLGPIDAYVSRPAGSGKHPGVVVIHEIWGLNDHIREVADRFAAEGYVVLAPHLFSSKHVTPGLTEDIIRAVMEFFRTIPPEKQRDPDYAKEMLAKLPDERRKMVAEHMDSIFSMPEDKLTEELVKGVEYLKSLENTGESIGSVGFCFGGSMSGLLACTGLTDASVIFYGSNPDPIESVKNIRGAVLGIYGGTDKRINAGLPELVKAMSEYEKDFEMCLYPGAPHAFFNNTHKLNYREAAAKDAWQRVLGFYSRKLKRAK